MDSDEFRAILKRSRVGIWEMIDAAIRVASSNHGDELRLRRDKIIESLYAPTAKTCRNCGGDSIDDGVNQDRRFHRITNYTNNRCDDIDDDVNSEDYKNKRIDVVDGDNDNEIDKDLDRGFSKSPLTPESNHQNFNGGEEEGDLDPYGGLFDDEQTKILTIKEQLEDPNQSEDVVVDLLHNLSDMDITFQALKETDIGRHVNRLRKHSSDEIRMLVMQLVRKWKEIVDDWVRVNQPQATSNLIVAERNHVEGERKPKSPQSAPRRKPSSRQPQLAPKSSSAPPPNRAQEREVALDDERLNSARRRLQENYQEAQNAKRQRTIQVMDIHEIPKPKNTFFAKNKGGRHH